MNKYGVEGKAIQATNLILTCIIIALCFWAVYRISIVFSSSNESGPAGSTSVSPAQYTFEDLPSTLDIQRELNRRDPKLKLKEDGVCGPATQAAWDDSKAHEALNE